MSGFFQYDMYRICMLGMLIDIVMFDKAKSLLFYTMQDGSRGSRNFGFGYSTTESIGVSERYNYWLLYQVWAWQFELEWASSFEIITTILIVSALCLATSL